MEGLGRGNGWAPEDLQAADSHRAASLRLVSRSVALVGFMGVGKTSVGRELALRLGRPFLDTDTLVEERTGRTIPELFAVGEAHFRRAELDAVRHALTLPPCVLALGGGAFTQPEAAALLLEQSLVVHLYTPWTSLVAALPDLARDRPLLRDRAVWEVEDLFLRRSAVYRRAHLRISLPRTTPVEAADVVAAVLRRPALTAERQQD